MRICVVHLGDVCDCLIASSLNRGFLRKYNQPRVTWVVKGEDQKSLFAYTNGVNALLVQDFVAAPETYDLLVNLSPSVHPSDPSVKATEVVGLNFAENSSEHYEVLYGNRKTTMNLFQVYFRLAGMTWRGEGYGITYYPKSKARKNCAAIAIDHAKLRHYVSDNLDMDTLKMFLVPYKKNIFKRMDEINKASYVLTDDRLTMHIGIYLRKSVHFLETIPLNAEPEFFGQGRIYRVPAKIVA